MQHETGLLSFGDQRMPLSIRANALTFTALCDDSDPALNILGMEGFKVLWYGDPLRDYVVQSFDPETKTITVTPRQTLSWREDPTEGV